MDKGQTKKKVCKLFISYQKELKWLEEMAAQGWFLTDIHVGMFYNFDKGEPKRMVYDIDRFNLSKKPSLEEIRRKEVFMEMAQEMGWQEIAHDSSMNYYFRKEYEEGGVNRLHNDEESRLYRADKFMTFMMQQAKKDAFWALVIVCVDFFIRCTQLYVDKPFEWFHWFTLIYVAACNGMTLMYWRWSISCKRELALTREEWIESIDPATHKTLRRLILTNRGLNRFLSRQSALGWTLTGVTPTRYFFEKSKGTEQVYTMDSKWLVNKRREALGEEKIGDAKDIIGLNNDWEIQSVRSAEEKGWSFVCALENRSIIYKGEAGKVAPLNDPKYDNSLRWISLIGQYGFSLLLCALLGAVSGFLAAYFGI